MAAEKHRDFKTKEPRPGDSTGQLLAEIWRAMKRMAPRATAI
jgi:hypothetical protein